MKTLLLPLCLGLAGLAPSPQDGPAVAAASDELVSAYEAIDQAYQKAYDAWLQRYRAAETDEAREEVGQAKPDVEGPAAQMLALAARGPTTETAYRACTWICTRSATESTGRALAHVSEHFLHHPKIGDLARRLRADDEDAERFLRTVLDKSTVEHGRAMACYMLVEPIKRRLTRWSTRPENADELMARIEPLYARLQDEFGDVILYGRKTLAQVAQGDLFELKHLGIGQTVPEIEGEDIDGVAFKLSDYRGKVVMLDFWGDW